MVHTKLDAKPLVAATVRIDGSVRIDRPPVAQVTVLTGQEVHLMLRYTINEGSVERESYRFQAESQVGGISHPPEERVHRDQPVTHDVWIGTLGHRYRFEETGVYEGTFRGKVEYGQKGWLSGKDVDHRTEDVVVPVRITVV